MSQKYDLALFTAGTQHYGELMLKCIDPEGRFFKHKLYRNNVTEDGYKDLLKFCHPLSRVVLIDDNPMASKYQVYFLIFSIIYFLEFQSYID